MEFSLTQLSHNSHLGPQHEENYSLAARALAFFAVWFLLGGRIKSVNGAGRHYKSQGSFEAGEMKITNQHGNIHGRCASMTRGRLAPVFTVGPGKPDRPQRPTYAFSNSIQAKPCNPKTTKKSGWEELGFLLCSCNTGRHIDRVGRS